ncbi:adenylyl-sulfate kinase [Mucilaginibacter sp. FT3.2]|uniref:adenylyl-sulfate kinase n=1 Tax=Mucilaginibacter sp. FT3.2 TaxID=2723090 RepID=UPI001614A939|nr:adenylyl-sulfate kinase [Mucilaginibacter sp. FT3.2]MBB6229815.1 adenylyl-sulfate kinase [Mucilaginibacter sp. FT3.2]
MLFNQLQAILSAGSVLNQNGMVIWLMGLSGAGKTTIAELLQEKLADEGFFSIVLDGDMMRETISKDLGFTSEDRLENVRRVAEIAQMLAQNNVITICSLITPQPAHQQIVRDTVKAAYFEIFVDCPVEICEKRDVKGLYKLARQNKIKSFTGVSAPFIAPPNAHLVLNTSKEHPEESMTRLYNQVIPFIPGNDL